MLPASHRGRLVAPAVATARAFAEYRAWLEGRWRPCRRTPRWAATVHRVPPRGRPGAVHARTSCSRWVGRSGSAPWRSRRSSSSATARCRRCRSSADQAAQMATSATDEAAIRTFLEANDLLTVPAWMRHYRNLPLPAYLAPLSFLGVTDDLTSETRLKEDGYSYIRVPSPEPALLLSVDGARPAADHRPRGRARPLFPARVCRGRTRTRSGATTTTPARTKASASTPRR